MFYFFSFLFLLFWPFCILYLHYFTSLWKAIIQQMDNSNLIISSNRNFLHVNFLSGKIHHSRWKESEYKLWHHLCYHGLPDIIIPTIITVCYVIVIVRARLHKSRLILKHISESCLKDWFHPSSNCSNRTLIFNIIKKWNFDAARDSLHIISIVHFKSTNSAQLLKTWTNAN